MKERIQQYRDRLLEIWNKTTLVQRIAAITVALLVLLIILFFFVVNSRPNFVQLYANLSERETGEITARLTEMGIEYELTPDGRGISVPSEVAAQVKVDLAAEGIPQSGSITYESFAQNMNFGMTDRQFNVVERDAMQNELRQMMIQGIEGIKNAQVMITLPQETIWVNQEQGQATASIILEIEPGNSLDQRQINALYTLVSKSIPNLPLENIIITNQYGEELVPDFDHQSNALVSGDFERLHNIKKEVERDLERGIQQLLGGMLGPKNVVVQAFATMDFTQETREENLVQAPYPEESKEGLIISMERLSESYNSQGGQGVGGIVGPGETDIPGYQADAEAGNSNYEKTNDLINYEVNRITKTIVESPYKIKDLSINVGVQPPQGNPELLTDTVINDLKQVVKNVVRTALSTQGAAFTDEDLNNRIMVMAMNFNTQEIEPNRQPINPLILYGVGAIALLAIAGVIYLMVKRRRSEETEEELIPTPLEIPPIETVETEETIIRKQIERLAKEKPKDFVTLLRTWLAED